MGSEWTTQRGFFPAEMADEVVASETEKNLHRFEAYLLERKHAGNLPELYTQGHVLSLSQVALPSHERVYVVYGGQDATCLHCNTVDTAYSWQLYREEGTSFVPLPLDGTLML